MAGPLVNFIIRGCQALFAIVVLGLSVTLIRGHHWGSLPSSLGFAAFVGGISFLVAIIGLAGTWFEFLAGKVGLILDGVVALLNIACGILFAVKLGNVKCELDIDDRNGVNNVNKIGANEWFNGGCRKLGGETWCWNEFSLGDNKDKIRDTYLGHCREAQADTVFMFLTAVALLASGLLLFLRARKGY